MKNYRRLNILFITLILLVSSKESLPQLGQLNTLVRQEGIVTTALNLQGNSYLYSTAIQSEGKIVAAGSSYIGSKGNSALFRYDTKVEQKNDFVKIIIL